MPVIVSSRIHDDIVGLIDGADRVVVLISPFIEPWPDLVRAVARAVARGVHLTVITRGPWGPSETAMAAFVELEAEILEVPGLHLKAYLSEKAALDGSVNLTKGSLGRSLDHAKRYERSVHRDGWNDVFEIWQRAVDDHTRVNDVASGNYGGICPEKMAAPGM